MGQLDGRVAIVTGSAVGLGRAIALAYAAEGAKVVVNYSRSEKDAQETAAKISEMGGEVLLVRADVSNDEQVRSMVAQTLERFDRIDILVNNAGITNHAAFTDLEALTDEVWDRILGVNVKGTFFCCRAVAEAMKRQGHGRIINFSSVAGIRPQGSSIAYCVSKSSVIHMSRCLARALGPEIQVNVIAPSFVEGTRWNEGRADVEAVKQRTIKASALGRVGTPEDIVEVALFLATRASFMTGTVQVVDGGRELG
jgi:3-oxoacyl-[acyl-carrier protein] reductase